MKLSKKADGVELRFAAIGTEWAIEFYNTSTSHITQKLQQSIQARIALFDHQYSRFRDDSLVARMARQAGIYRLPADAKPLLDMYHHLYQLTGGAVTPLIGQVLADAGYDAGYTLRPQSLRQPPVWDDVLQYKYPELTLKKPALLDFGALGKGYLVDLLAQLLREQGIKAFCLDASGDMSYQQTGRYLEVGLEHPVRSDEVIGVVKLPSGQSLCGSAINRRAWGAYHHIIDPQKLTSPRHILATWAVADTTMLADALTTCLFFVSPELLQTRYTFSYALVYADYSLKHSQDFPAAFFTSKGAR